VIDSIHTFIGYSENQLGLYIEEYSPLNLFLKKRKVNLQIHSVGFYKTPVFLKKTDDVIWDKFLKWSFFGKKLELKLIFQIKNYDENITALESRSLIEKDYSKFIITENKPLIYGLNQDSLKIIFETKEVFITEGIFDYNFVKQVFPNTISFLSANHSPNDILFLKRFVNTVNILFDSDLKGRMATSNLSKILTEFGIKTRNLVLPEKDPAAFFEKNKDSYAISFLKNKYLEAKYD